MINSSQMASQEHKKDMATESTTGMRCHRQQPSTAQNERHFTHPTIGMRWRMMRSMSGIGPMWLAATQAKSTAAISPMHMNQAVVTLILVVMAIWLVHDFVFWQQPQQPSFT